MGAVHTTLTMEEFPALPDLPAGKRELLRGERIDGPPAKFMHDEIAHRLYEGLKMAVAAAGIDGRVYVEIGYRLSPRHWLKPDVGITYPNQPVDDYLQDAPQLAIEIAEITAQRHRGVFLSQLLNGEPIDLDQILAI